MYSPEMNYLVFQEQQKDRLRAIEREQQLRAAGLDTRWQGHKRACIWLGRHLKRWGTKLEQLGDASPVQQAVEA